MLLSRRLIGRRFRVARLSLGFGEDEFAHEVGLAPDAYRDIERGDAVPDLETLTFAARITGKSIDFLLTGRSPEMAD